MRHFAISGYFQAETIDDAFAFLAEHFAGLQAGEDCEHPSCRLPHSFEIKPLPVPPPAQPGVR